MDREQQILALIRRNPFVSQREIAGRIGLSRSAVAGHIASLTRKGIIRGRAYIKADEGSVACIGGANLDSKATGNQPLRPAASNPVAVTQACGGVARNIAANLARLSCRVTLLTLVGDDQAGRWVLDETGKLGVDTGPSVALRGEKTGSYTALLEPDGELFVAFADMNIYDRFTPDLLQEKWPHIAASKLVVADANLPADSLHWLVERCRAEALPLFVDPISPEKAKKLPHSLLGVTAVFPNAAEACELAGTPLQAEPDCRALADAIRARGAGHVFITLGRKGVYYAGEAHEGLLLPAIPTEVVEVTGAGDAFLAGVVYGVLRGLSYPEACRRGLAAAHLALQTADSASDLLNEERLNQALIQSKGSDPH
jgi:pseudouridine kinase